MRASLHFNVFYCTIFLLPVSRVVTARRAAQHVGNVGICFYPLSLELYTTHYLDQLQLIQELRNALIMNIRVATLLPFCLLWY